MVQDGVEKAGTVIHARLPAPFRRASPRGCGAGSRAETIRYLKMASRSACETESHLQIARDLRFLHPKAAEQFLASAQAIQRMLASLIDKLPE
jgi:four helix bundle protein